MNGSTRRDIARFDAGLLLPFTLDQLLVFVQVVEHGSFSAAGRALHRAQSAISYGIAHLEEALGVSLFDRGTRRVALTPAGRHLLPAARSVLEQAGSLRARAAELAGGLEAEVSLAVDAILPPAVLVELCTAFQERYPDVSLRLRTDVLGSVAALVRGGGCAIGVCSAPVGLTEGLVAREVARVAMVPVAAGSHPLARLSPAVPLPALRDQVQIVISEHSPERQTTGDQAVLSNITWRVADAPTKLWLIRAGLGWGNLPLAMVERELAEGSLARLAVETWGPAPMRVPLFAVSRAAAPPGPAGRWLVEHLGAICSRDPRLSIS